MSKAKLDFESLAKDQDIVNQDLIKSLKDYEAKAASQPTPNELAKKYQAKDDFYLKNFESLGIEPTRLYDKMDTGAKIATGIAMILGGFGSGLTGQHNEVMKFINNAIANDIDAQKNEQGKAHSLWKMNRERFKSDIEANLATSNQYLGLVKIAAMRAEAGAQNVAAKERLTKLVMGIDQQIALQNWMRSRAGGGASGTEAEFLGDSNVMKVANPDLYKDMQSKYIPNRGITDKPPSDKNLQVLEALDNFKQLSRRAEAFAKNEAGWMGTIGVKVPVLGTIGTAKDAEAESIRVGLYDALPAIRGIAAGSDAKLDMFSKLISSPGAFRKEKFLSQLAELNHDAEVRQRSVYNQIGLNPFKKAPEDIKAIEWAKNPKSMGWNEQDARAILEQNGF